MTRVFSISLYKYDDTGKSSLYFSRALSLSISLSVSLSLFFPHCEFHALAVRSLVAHDFHLSSFWLLLWSVAFGPRGTRNRTSAHPGVVWPWAGQHGLSSWRTSWVGLSCFTSTSGGGVHREHLKET